MRLPKMIAATALLSLAATVHAGKPDTGFTIAAIPDTQNYLDYTHQTAEGFPFDANAMFLDQLRYVAAHTKDQGGDIVFVSALGDIWQHQTLLIDPAHEARGFKRIANPFMDKEFAPSPKVGTVEMPAAKQGYAMIAGKVPFAVVPGNHDYDAMWTDANHPPAAKFTDMSSLGMLHSGGLDNWRKVFGADTAFFKDKPWYVASHDGGADSAQIFTAGGYRFLHIGLQFDAPNASLEWAATIIHKYPGLPTIVTMHDYLQTDGSRLPNPLIDNHAVDPLDNTPQMIWDKFLKQHDQIFLVLCGHEHAQAFRTDDNAAGHKVYQILSDYQDRHQTAIDANAKLQPGMGIGDGWMRLMRFEMGDATPTIHVRTYSTHYKTMSADEPRYIGWYKAQEKPKLSDEAYKASDDFTVELTDFRARFGAPKP